MTGVQTCALPISGEGERSGGAGAGEDGGILYDQRRERAKYGRQRAGEEQDARRVYRADEEDGRGGRVCLAAVRRLCSARRNGSSSPPRWRSSLKRFPQLRKECLEQDVHAPPPKDRRATEVRTPASSRPFSDSPSSSTDAFPTYDNQHLPSLSRERNRLTLRAYLRSLLANPVLGSSGAFQSFLVESPIRLGEKEMRDVEVREEMDRIREEEARSFRVEVEDRVAELEGYLRGFREELVKSDGLTRVFGTIRQTDNILDLPIEYRKVIEWARISYVPLDLALFARADTRPLAASPQPSTNSSSAPTTRPPSSPSSNACTA